MGLFSDKKSVSLRSFDWWLFAAMSFLCIVSLFFVYSSGINSVGVLVSDEWVKQLVWVVSGLGLFFLFAFLDYNRLKDIAPLIYIVCLFLLVLVLAVGANRNGSKSWLGVGFLGIQPSEFAKAGAVIMLASYLDSLGMQIRSAKRLAVCCVIALAPVILIARQPDFGSAMIFFAILFGMLYAAGAPVRYLLFVAMVGVFIAIGLMLPIWNQYIADKDFWLANILGSPEHLIKLSIAVFIFFLLALAGCLFFKKDIYFYCAYTAAAGLFSLGGVLTAELNLKPYQWQRLATFLNPNIDPKGAGWHALQSFTAIGSGGLSGRGYLQGSHSHNRFLPEQSTDFILSIISEESGFLGSAFLLLVYSLILGRLLYISTRATNAFGANLCAGAFSIIFAHVAINAGMVIGMVPITGIPLLLLSYGGSSVWLTMSLLGMAMSVYIRRFKN